jgi:hypothetical protein
MLASMILLSNVNAQTAVPGYEQVPNPQVLPSPPETEEVAIVAVVASVGGTTDPEPGVYEYPYGETINLEATPNEGYRFAYWLIRGQYTPGHNQPPINYPENYEADPDWIPDFPDPSEVAEDSLTSSTNPLNIICGYGYTYSYQPVFTSISAPDPGDNAVVIVLDAAGGTTNPGPGTYTYLPDESVSLSATADDGFEFQYWVATGAEPGHDAVLVDSSLDITCQAGYTYSYQPVYRPTDSTVPSDGGMPAEYLYAIIVVLAIIAVIGIAAALMYRGKSK